MGHTTWKQILNSWFVNEESDGEFGKQSLFCIVGCLMTGVIMGEFLKNSALLNSFFELYVAAFIATLCLFGGGFILYNLRGFFFFGGLIIFVGGGLSNNKIIYVGLAFLVINILILLSWHILNILKGRKNG